jgi:hypothetical protein
MSDLRCHRVVWLESAQWLSHPRNEFLRGTTPWRTIWFDRLAFPFTNRGIATALYAPPRVERVLVPTWSASTLTDKTTRFSNLAAG